MIRVRTLGMLDVAKMKSDITSDSAVDNYTFLTVDGEVYLIANILSGDDADKEDIKIAAGEYLNGFLVKAWDTQELIVDEKHITYGSGESYSDLVAGTTLLKVASDGTLEITTSTPTSGVYFKVVSKVTLTEKAVVVKVIVADKDTASS